jgi:hypothetical protein
VIWTLTTTACLSYESSGDTVALSTAAFLVGLAASRWVTNETDKRLLHADVQGRCRCGCGPCHHSPHGGRARVLGLQRGRPLDAPTLGAVIDEGLVDTRQALLTDEACETKSSGRAPTGVTAT